MGDNQIPRWATALAGVVIGLILLLIALVVVAGLVRLLFVVVGVG